MYGNQKLILCAVLRHHKTGIHRFLDIGIVSGDQQKPVCIFPAAASHDLYEFLVDLIGKLVALAFRQPSGIGAHCVFIQPAAQLFIGRFEDQHFGIIAESLCDL